MDDAEHPPPASLCKSSFRELTSSKALPSIPFAMSPKPTQTTTAAHCSTCEHVVHDLAQGVATSVKVATTTSYAEWLEQSPVDISTSAAMPLVQAPDAIELRLGHVAAELELGAHNFQVNWNSKRDNYIMIDGKVFYTVQFHFHTPSEHTIDGEPRAMEMHLVHQADDGTLAVVGLMFEEGEENAFLAQFSDDLPLLTKENNRIALGQLNPKYLTLLEGAYFRYRGSLTTPPYTEGVEWIVMRDTVDASAEQIAAVLCAIGKPNARETLPLHQRIVRLVDELP